MLTREELKPSAKIYFVDKTRLEIFGTQDKQFFYTADEAKKYCNGKMLFFRYDREDFIQKRIKVEKKEKIEVKEESIKTEKPPVKKSPKKTGGY